MARKGKEPAGLRRYRLAQKRKKAGRKRVRRVRAAPTRRRSTMARRRGRKRRSKSKPAIPMAVVVPPLYVAYSRINQYGFTPLALAGISKDIIGYDPNAKTYAFDNHKAFIMGEVAGIVVHKVASKMGVNRAIKKMTFGYLSL